MILEQFLEQERNILNGVHCHDGVWWRRTSFGCCQPLYPLQEIVPWQSKPMWRESYLRYKHIVPSGIASNQVMTFMMISEEDLKSFCFEKLPREKRKAIKRARKSGVVVKQLTTLDGNWNALQKIFVSTAMRTQYGLPPEYYTKQENLWRRTLSREFELGNREWFGAFINGKLVGYLYACIVDNFAWLLVTKFDFEFNQARPSDALHYHVIEFYRGHPDCRAVCAGETNALTPTIDRFKRQWGFKPKEYSAYQTVNRPARLVISGLLGTADMILGWQDAGSKRNLRYTIRGFRESLNKWGR